jgi:hypothetical protein
VVPDITSAFAAEPPYQPVIAGLVAASLSSLDPDTAIVLVGHSGAGPLLPGMAHALSHDVLALVYADALLPYPGEAWLAHAPQSLVKDLRSRARTGLLPPWHEWFPAEAIAEILPDPQLRNAFIGEVPRLPSTYFEEPTSTEEWHGVAGYLLLSDAYQEDAATARRLKMPVVEHIDHHLAMLTAPVAVASALDHLISITGSGGIHLTGLV